MLNAARNSYRMTFVSQTRSQDMGALLHRKWKPMARSIGIDRFDARLSVF